MNKQEFIEELKKFDGTEELIERITGRGGAILYQKVELVYNFHPAIDNLKGKHQIAKLVATAGYGIIDAMLPDAMTAKDLDDERMEIHSKMLELQRAEDVINDKLAGLASGWRIIRSE